MTSRRPAGQPGMTFSFVIAQATVSDVAVAEPWWTALLGRGPDARPMDGLLEWRLDGAGLQVWQEPERAGRSTVVLGVDDLDAELARVSAAGLLVPLGQAGGGGRTAELRDPDGNRAVLFQP